MAEHESIEEPHQAAADRAAGGRRLSSGAGINPVLGLQQAAGNRAVTRLLRAASDPAAPLHAGVRKSVERVLGRRIGDVRVHDGPASESGAASSPALGLRRRIQLSPVARLIQRDLTDEHEVGEGKFKMDLRTESHAGAKSGMSGTIKFTPKAAAPDSTSIRLYQALRFENLTTGGEVAWPGAYAGRTNTQTAADPGRGIEPGWGIDHDPTAATPRTKLADPTVSPYYRRWWPNALSSQDGSKAGATIQPASLWDYPGTSGPNVRFTFETVAQASDTGHVYGSVAWGFTVSDVAKGTVTGEHSVGRDVTTATTDEAMRRFNEYYRNPGATTAPTT